LPIQDISIGQYAPRNSVIHRLDPRTKLIASASLTVVIFLLQRLESLCLVLGVLCALCGVAKLSPLLVLKNLRPFWALLLFTLGLHGFYSEGRILWELPALQARLTEEGLRQGVFYTMRIVDLTVLGGFFTLSTSPMSFADAVEKLLSPFRRLGVPSHELAMVMSISLRFIPILSEETIRIRNAQVSRGIRMDGGPLRKLQATIPILVPLFVSSFHRANDLALAMDARCYRGGSNRTSYRALSYRFADVLALAGLGVLGSTMVFAEHLIARV
jgi:energy-coupling factor transport system permease protein